MDKLVLTVQETAEALGVSDDLVYELTAQGVLPCLHLGRRRVIPRRAVDLLIEECVGNFDAGAVLPRLGRSADGG
jgi:excisionase family DNA binding protein